VAAEVATGRTVDRDGANDPVVDTRFGVRPRGADMNDKRTPSARRGRQGFLKLTLLVLVAYLAVGGLLSMVYPEREILREGFQFAAAVPGGDTDRSLEQMGPLVVDAARQHEIDQYLAWSQPPTDATRLLPPVNPPTFPPEYRLGAEQKTYAILNPLTFQPLQSRDGDWEWAVLMARRGRLDLLDTATGVRSTLTGRGLEQPIERDLGVSRPNAAVVVQQLGHYRPAPRGVGRTVFSKGSEIDRFVAEGDFVSRSFDLNSERPVAISLETDLSNAWMSVQGRLHSREAGQQREFSLMLREVHGHGPATTAGEAGVRRVRYLPAVPPGTYTLHLHAERSSASTAQLLMQVHEGGEHHWGTLFWLMVVVGGVGAGLGLVSFSEQKMSEA